MPDIESFKQGNDMIKCMFCKDKSGSSSVKGWRESTRRKNSTLGKR